MSWKLTFLVAVALVAVAGVAVAASGGSSKDVVLCAAKGGGALSLAPKSGKCAKGAKKLVIAKQGPQGQVGPAGASGAPGTVASVQPEAVIGVTTPTSAGCAAAPGSFCGSSGSGVRWADAGGPYVAVGYWKDATGEVHLQGTIDSTGGAGVLSEEFFYLPAGYRPVGKRTFMLANCNAGEPFVVFIEPSGLVKMEAFAANTCPSFDGVSFRP